MNKTELIEKIAASAKLTKADSKKALDATIEAIAGALKKGDKVQLVGFGTFSVAKKPAREGINPATKAKIKIAAKKVAKFKAGAELAKVEKFKEASSTGSLFFVVCWKDLLRLLSNICKDTTIHIQYMTVNGVRGM